MNSSRQLCLLSSIILLVILFTPVFLPTTAQSLSLNPGNSAISSHGPCVITQQNNPALVASTITCFNASVTNDLLTSKYQQTLTTVVAPVGATFVQVSGSMANGCALTNKGKIQCWSSGYPYLSDTYYQAGNPWIYLSSYEDDGNNMYVCALRQDHSPACWTYDLSGSASSLTIPGGPWSFHLIEVGNDRTCGSVLNKIVNNTRPQPRVVCWATQFAPSFDEITLPTSLQLTGDTDGRWFGVAQLVVHWPSTVLVLFENGYLHTPDPFTDISSYFAFQTSRYKQIGLFYGNPFIGVAGIGTKPERQFSQGCGILMTTGDLVCNGYANLTQNAFSDQFSGTVIQTNTNYAPIALSVGNGYVCTLTRPADLSSAISMPDQQAEMSCYRAAEGTMRPARLYPSLAYYVDRDSSCPIMLDGTMLLYYTDSRLGRTHKQVPGSFISSIQTTDGCCGVITDGTMYCYTPSSLDTSLPILSLRNGQSLQPAKITSAGNTVCGLYTTGALGCAGTGDKASASPGAPTNFSQVALNSNLGWICAIVKGTERPACTFSPKLLNSILPTSYLINNQYLNYTFASFDNRQVELILPPPPQAVLQAMIVQDVNGIPMVMSLVTLNSQIEVRPFRSNTVNVTWAQNTINVTAVAGYKDKSVFASLLDCGADGQCGLTGAGEIICWIIDLKMSSGFFRTEPRILPRSRRAEYHCTGACDPGIRRRLMASLPTIEVILAPSFVFSSISYMQTTHSVCGVTTFSQYDPVQVENQVRCFRLDFSEPTPSVSDIPLQVYGLAPKGSYQLGTQTIKCANGTFSSDDGASNSICSGLCIESTYGNSNDITASCTATCPAGSYCPAGSTQPLPCPPGVYGLTPGLTTSHCSAVCSIGYYCQLGSVTITPCLAGYYGNHTGLSVPTCDGGCEAGYICPLGSTWGQQAWCGSAAFYCPANSSIPQVISPGFYGILPAQPPPAQHFNWTFGGRAPCEAGYQCTGDGTKKPCDIGSSSPMKSSYCALCAPGKHQNRTGQGECDDCTPGRFSGDSGAKGDECSPCPTGSYQPESGKISCINADAGFYTDQEGSTDKELKPCPIGRFSLGGASECRNCSLGTYQDEIGQLSCKVNVAGNYTNTTGNAIGLPCPYGTYAAGQGTINCSLCPRGTQNFNKLGAISCDECPAGRFSAALGFAGKDCNPCLKGTYSQAGKTTCLACEPGKYQSLSTTDGCNPSPPGTIAPGEATFDPIMCLPGTYSFGGATECTNCSIGYYQDESGQSTCKPAPAGMIVDSPGSGIPRNCSSGWYADTSSSCLQAKPGTFTSVSEGASRYEDCAKGTASNRTGLYSPDGCPVCQPGYAAPTRGQTQCDRCDTSQGYYAPGQSTVDCLKCTNGGVVNDEGTQCTRITCRANYELKIDDTTGVATCRVCPIGKSSSAGGECTQCATDSYTPGEGSGCISCNRPDMEGLNCAGGYASVKEGYWAFEVVTQDPEILQSFNASGRTFRVYQTSPCPNSLCPGSQLQTLNSTSGKAIVYDQCPERRLQSDDNLLCAECAEGFITWYGDCVECSTARTGFILLLIVISFAFTMFLLWMSGATSAGVSSIVIYFLQTAQLEVGETSNILAWIRIVNLNVSNTGGSSTCLGPLTSYQQTILAILTPIILLIELGIIMAVHYIAYRMSSSSRNSQRPALDGDFDRSSIEVVPVPEESLPTNIVDVTEIQTPRKRCVRWADSFSLNRYIAGAFAVLLFTYTQVGSTILSFLHCVNVGDLGRVVFDEPTQNCNSSTYHDVEALVIIALIIYIFLFPLLMLFFIGRHRDWIVEHSTALSPVSAQFAYLTRFSPLISPYHASAWYWSLLILLRRLLFVTVNTYLVLDPGMRACLFVLFNFVAYCLQVLIQPYKTKELNRVDQISHIALVFISALLTAYSRPPFPTYIQVLLFLLIVPLACVLIVRVLHQWCTRKRHLKSMRNIKRDMTADDDENNNDDGEGRSTRLTTHPVVHTAAQPSPKKHVDMIDVHEAEIGQHPSAKLPAAPSAASASSPSSSVPPSAPVQQIELQEVRMTNNNINDPVDDSIQYSNNPIHSSATSPASPSIALPEPTGEDAL